MPATKIADVIVPEVFNPYVIERTAELANLFLGGAIGQDAELNTLATAGGTLINMPFWKDLTGASEVLSDAAALTVNNITSDKDQARLQLRGKAWGVNDLARALSGDDPMRAIADLVAQYWARDMQIMLIASLEGLFADNIANDTSDMVVDVSIPAGTAAVAANLMGADAVIDAATTMGDVADRITAIAMHSKPFSTLQKANVITYESSAADANIRIPRYLGYRVIVDDKLPVVPGATDGFVYTSYLFGEGALGFGQGGAPVPTEVDRDSLAGEDILINRQHFLLHPRGVKWTEAAVAAQAPTDAELATVGNWDRVWERKNVRLAALKTNG